MRVCSTFLKVILRPYAWSFVMCQKLGLGYWVCARDLSSHFSAFSALCEALSLLSVCVCDGATWLEMFDTRDGRARATARAVDTYIAYYPTTVSHTKYTGTPLRPPRGISAISRRLRCLATDRPPVVAWSAHPDPRLITVMSHTPKVHQRRQAPPAAGRPLPLAPPPPRRPSSMNALASSK